MHFQQVIIVSVIATLLWGIGIAPAAADDIQKAQEIYGQAVESYKLKNFDAALQQFKEAYNLSGKSAILYNLAICHEKLGQTDHAIAYYELYLEENPDADDADAITQKVTWLKNPESKPAPKETTETPKEPQASDASATPQQEEAAPKPKESASQGPLQVIAPPDPNARKIKIAQGMLISVGALVFATGGLTAIAAFKKYDGFEAICAPSCSNDQVTKVRRLSVAADIQMGVGLAAVTTGVVWMIIHKKNKDALPNRADSDWQLIPQLAHTGSGLSISRRF